MTNAPDTDQRVIPPSLLRNRLRDAREYAELEQIDIATELGVARSTVSNYERGVTKPGKLVVSAWAVVCKVDVDWLKYGQEGPPPIGPGGGHSNKELRFDNSHGVLLQGRFGQIAELERLAS